MVMVLYSIARCILFGVPRLPIRPCDERPPAMYGHFCLVPRVSVHDRYYCISVVNVTAIAISSATLCLFSVVVATPSSESRHARHGLGTWAIAVMLVHYKINGM